MIFGNFYHVNVIFGVMGVKGYMFCGVSIKSVHSVLFTLSWGQEWKFFFKMTKYCTYDSCFFFYLTWTALGLQAAHYSNLLTKQHPPPPLLVSGEFSVIECVETCLVNCPQWRMWLGNTLVLRKFSII